MRPSHAPRVEASAIEWRKWHRHWHAWSLSFRSVAHSTALACLHEHRRFASSAAAAAAGLLAEAFSSVGFRGGFSALPHGLAIFCKYVNRRTLGV
jgi:hypothetical protein